jgi:hypothetical protein
VSVAVLRGPGFGVAELPAWAYSLAYDDADSVVCVGDDDWGGVNGDQPVGRWRRREGGRLVVTVFGQTVSGR